MIKEILCDERGKLSAARVLLLGCLIFTGVLILFDSALWGDVSNAVYALLGTVFTGLLAWSAGPRIAQYILPQIGAIAQGIGASVIKSPQRPDLLDNNVKFKENDEK